MYVPDVKKMFACGSNIKIALTNFTDDEGQDYCIYCNIKAKSEIRMRQLRKT